MGKQMFRQFRLKTQFNLVLAVIILLLVAASFGLFNTITPINQHWDAYQDNVAVRQTLLMEIKSTLGYGGTIHNFKNYVLRGSEKYQQRLQENFSKLDELLDRYANLPALLDTEKAALSSLTQVVHLYQSKLDVVKGMVADGKYPHEIDRSVKIDDGPAFEAFDKLDAAYRQHTIEVSRLLSERIDSAVSAGLWTGAGVILFIALSFFFLSNNIVRGINDILTAMLTAEKEKNIETRLPITGRDEISQLATSFNDLMDKFVIMVVEVSRSASSVGIATVKQSTQVEFTVADVHRQNGEIEQVAAAISRFRITDVDVQLHQAKAAHMALRVHLQAYLSGKGNLDQSQAVSHTECSLGEWYYSAGLRDFGHLPELQALERPHSELHALINRIIDLKKTGRLPEAEREFEKVAPLSAQIMTLLERIESAIKKLSYA